jgi:hypothetical protein
VSIPFSWIEAAVAVLAAVAGWGLRGYVRDVNRRMDNFEKRLEGLEQENGREFRQLIAKMDALSDKLTEVRDRVSSIEGYIRGEITGPHKIRG